MDRPRARRAAVATVLMVVVAVLVLAGPPVCPTALFLGVPCPGCGLTRATLALLQGDVAGALHFHPLVLLLAPLLAVAIGAALLEFVRGGPADESRITAWLSSRVGYGVAGGLLVLTLFVWGARFAGFFGGPAPVESLRDLAISRSR